MRIIAGKLGGRLFDTPTGHRTHPMGDKIRGALFNILGDIENLTVLDAFAGSGALGFEAISRGAKHVTAVENDRNAQDIIAQNIGKLDLAEHIQLIKATAQAWLKNYNGSAFDIILLDPPYNNLQLSALQRLASLAVPNGVIVLSWPADVALPQFEHFTLILHRRYANAQLLFYSPLASGSNRDISS